MSQTIIAELKKVKAASYNLALMDEKKRSQVLKRLADQLCQSYEQILIENAKDLANMPKADPMYDRLLLTKERIHAIANDIESVTALTSSVGKIIDQNIMSNGLKIEKIIVPLGVIAVIYESRPNVTIDVFTLCFKTGNACVLKGGKEAQHTNTILVQIIHEVLIEKNIDPCILYLLPSTREASQTLLNAVGLVDVCIPRGSQALINFVRENAKIPIIETGAGIVHTYFDKKGDVVKGRLIINNAKTRRVSVCNALDCLIIHESRLDALYELIELLQAKSVEIFADPKSFGALTNDYPKDLLHHATSENYGQEYLSYKMAIKTVPSIEAAIEHIRQYSSGHSEAIITEDEQAKSIFLTRVDAAAVYVNASTAFTDGGQFGLGAEIGISTQKLHARGPMGLAALTSYKWLILGDGQIRNP